MPIKTAYIETVARRFVKVLELRLKTRTYNLKRDNTKHHTIEIVADY